jgi:uncharacterized protein (TIGR02284 family)
VSAEPVGRLESVDATASTLIQLVRASIEAGNGFRSAAAEIGDPNLQRLFESYSQQRAEFAAELQEELRRHEQALTVLDQATSPLQPDLMDLKASETGRDEGTIISERERGEDAAIKVYETALAAPLPAEIRSVVERQFLRIKEAHDQVRSLERAHNRHNPG